MMMMSHKTFQNKEVLWNVPVDICWQKILLKIMSCFFVFFYVVISIFSSISLFCLNIRLSYCHSLNSLQDLVIFRTKGPWWCLKKTVIKVHLFNRKTKLTYVFPSFRSAAGGPGGPQPAQPSKRLQQTQAQVDEVCYKTCIDF